MAQSKYYICTLGTSVANALKEVLWAKQKSPGEWDDRDEAFEKAAFLRTENSALNSWGCVLSLSFSWT